MKFKKNQKVVKLLNVMGTKTATIQVVSKVSKGVVHLVDAHSTYDAQNGREIESVLPGVSAEIIPFDDGEEGRWFPK